MPRYFVKNYLIHRYPVPDECEVTYDGEKIYNYLSDVPEGNSICDDCTFHSSGLFTGCISHMDSVQSEYISENIIEKTYVSENITEYKPEE